MEWGKAQKTFEELKANNRGMRILIGGLILLAVVQAGYNFTKETVVVIKPWTQTQDAEVGKSHASRTYKEAWGLAIAELLGNVTPKNVDIIIERIEPLLSPAIYNETKRSLDVEAGWLKDNRITRNFEPRTIEFEAKTDKVFIHGFSYTTSAVTGAGNSDKPQRTDVTYEFQIAIGNYMPVIKDLQMYQGVAHTTKVQGKLDKQLERQRAKEAKAAKEEME